ncbi:hypothetical protein C0J52_27808 [Blattella germanica]|nr:hypothetical protein C0J52_27808 [Blattella germanica]
MSCNASLQLVKIICVLLEELDQDILKYLLSIIPPPNLYGTFDVNSMKEEVREITGFSLLSTPAFHTWQGKNKPFSLDDFVVDPILEKSMKDFIARAYGLLPNIPSGTSTNTNANEKQVEKRTDANTKNRKRIDLRPKTKLKRHTKPKKTLLDELTRPQKKSLLSYLITPLDPITDNSDANVEPLRANGHKVDSKKKKKLPPPKKTPEETSAPSVESKENVPSASVTSEPAAEVSTQEVADDVSIIKCTPVIVPEVKKEAEAIAVEEIQSFTQEELGSCNMDIGFAGKDLEWNRENMKLFGITVTDDDICLSDSQVKDVETVSDNNKPPLPPTNVAPAKEQALPSNPQGNASFQSVTTKEYMQFPSDLTVTKYNVPQPTETALPLPVADNKECPQGAEQRKPAIDTCQNELPVPKFETCASATSHAMRNWPDYTGTMFDPQNALNLQRRRNLSLGFPGNAARIRHFVSQGAPMSNIQGQGLGPSSISASYESVYPFAQDWMMKPTNSGHPVPPPNWGPFPAHYGPNHPNFRDMTQQRTRLVQRATFLQQAPPPAVNNYMNPGHTLMMNNMWGSYPAVRSGLFTRAGDMPPLLPALPHPLYPMTDPMRQQHMRNMSQGMMPNYASSQQANPVQPPMQNKRRKLEEIVGRLKEAEKGT